MGIQDEKIIWRRVAERAGTEIRDYKDALVISQAMKELAENKLLLISGMHLETNS